MTIYTVKNMNGDRVRLFSDDTFTLAFCATRGNPTSQETTAEEMAECLPLASLAKLWDAEHSGKLSRAIRIATEY